MLKYTQITSDSVSLDITGPLFIKIIAAIILDVCLNEIQPSISGSYDEITKSLAAFPAVVTNWNYNRNSNLRCFFLPTRILIRLVQKILENRINEFINAQLSIKFDADEGVQIINRGAYYNFYFMMRPHNLSSESIATCRKAVGFIYAEGMIKNCIISIRD